MMLQRSVSLGKQTALVIAAFLLFTPQVLAGQPVRAGSRSPNRPQPAPTTVSLALPQPVTYAVVPVTISVAVTKPANPAPAEISVDLRSPDGQRRTFSVEGGPSAIQTQPVLVLRPGESVTIRLAAK